MKNSELPSGSFLLFLIKFLLLFAVLNYGTFYYIGIVSPGGYYIEFFDRYFDYPEGILKSLLWGCQTLFSILGIDTDLRNYDQVWVKDGFGVQIAYDCLGYGVLSFWAAYVLTNQCELKKKIKWLAGGWLLLWMINVIRISFVLIAVNQRWGMPLGIDHHTWFNIASYVFIFLMIYVFEKSLYGKNNPAPEFSQSSPDNEAKKKSL